MSRGKLVYIIEDEKDLCDMICRTLQAWWSNSGQGARQRIAKHPPDVCVVDLMLPDMDGLGLVKELSRCPATGIIVLTGRRDLSDRVLA